MLHFFVSSRVIYIHTYFIVEWFLLTNIITIFVFHMTVLVATLCTVAKFRHYKRFDYIVGFTAQTRHAIATKTKQLGTHDVCFGVQRFNVVMGNLQVIRL